MANVYETKVVSVGPEAEMFRAENMFILFGSEAPDNLKDYCYIIDRVQVKQDIAVGQKIVVDGVEYPITAVGSVAQKNLEGLGHISVVFNGATEAALDGSIYVDANGQEVPVLTQDSVFEIAA